MPTVTIEGPPLSLARKRKLASALTRLISRAYNWPARRLIIVIRENPDQNVARGGRLLCDRRKGRPAVSRRRKA